MTTLQNTWNLANSDPDGLEAAMALTRGYFFPELTHLQNAEIAEARLHGYRGHTLGGAREFNDRGNSGLIA